MENNPHNLMEQALNACNIGVWSFNILTKQVVWSDNIKAIFGTEHFGGQYEDYLALVHPDDLDRVSELIRKTLEEGRSSYHVVHRIMVSADSPDRAGIRWIEGLGKVFFDEDGGAKQMTGVVMDVTNRFLHETKLKVGQERLQLAIKAAGVGCYDWYPKDNELYWDQTMFHIFGMPYNYAGDKNEFFFERIHPDDKDRMQQAMAAMLSPVEKLNDFQNEYRVVVPGEKVKYIETWGRVFRDDHGCANRLLGVCIDITEKRLTEASLQREKDRYKSVLQTLGEGIAVYDLSGRIVECNQMLLTLFQADSTELIGRSVEEYITDNWLCFDELGNHVPHSDLPSVQTLRTRQSQRNIVLKFQHKRADILPIWVSVNCDLFHVEENGAKKVVGVVASFIDVSEQKRKEDEIRSQNEELRKANQELDNFVYRVSHDLRSPIASSLGIIDLIGDQCHKDTQELLSLQRESLMRMDTFIQDILHFSRNSRAEVMGKPIRLDQLIMETVDQLKHMDESQPVKVKIHIDVQYRFHSDPQRVQMILNNLISNSFRYRNPYLDEAIIHIWVTGDEQHIAFSIADNGQGIKSMHLERIFEMFYRASDNKPGSGLGLYIVKEAVDKLGGNIFVDSDFGKGTAFTVILPNLKSESEEVEMMEEEIV